MQKKMLQMGPWLLTLILAGGTLPGCDRSGSDKPASDVVAVVGSEPITLDEFNARLNEQPPFVRERYGTVERKREFLENMIRSEVLAQEARRRGLEKDPEVQATLEKLMVQKLVQNVAQGPDVAQVTEGELRSAYEENKAEYVRPERLRISQILLTAPADSRAKAKARAAQLLAELKKQEARGTANAFELAAREHSEDAASKNAGGDLGYRTREELRALGGPGLSEAAFALQTSGQLSAPVETEHGVHLLKLTARQPGVEQTFEAVRQRLESRMTAERRTKAVDDFIASLRKSTPVEIKDAVLAKAATGASEASRTAEPPKP